MQPPKAADASDAEPSPAQDDAPDPGSTPGPSGERPAGSTLASAGAALTDRVSGDEPLLPYQRPPLSKKYLAGALELDRLLIRPAHFYADHGITTHLGRRAVEIAQQPIAETLAGHRPQLLLDGL